jgi:TonB family protein
MPTVLVSPEYPAVAVAAKVESVIKVTVEISSKGGVTVVAQSPRVPLLEGAVLEALSQWRFIESESASQSVVTVTFRVKALECKDSWRNGYSVFKLPREVEVWGFSSPQCDPTVKRPARSGGTP